jgi:hypothetical protein
MEVEADPHYAAMLWHLGGGLRMKATCAESAYYRTPLEVRDELEAEHRGWCCHSYVDAHAQLNSDADANAESHSINFDGFGPTSGTFSFATPHRLVQLVFNGGATSSSITLACSGQATAQTTLAPGQLCTLQPAGPAPVQP